MGDLHEVVDLGPAPDDRGIHCRAIDRHVRADLHVVLDDHIANLWNLQPLRAVLHITEAVAADHRAGVNADAVADADVVVDGDIRVEQAIVAKAAAFADDAMGFDDRAVADCDVIAQDHVLTDKHALAKAHVAAELRGGMDLRGIETRRTKNRQGPRKRGARVFYPDQRLPRGGRAQRDDDDGGGAPFRGGAVFGIFRKRDLRGLRLRDRRDAGKRDVRVAFHLATDPRREILNGNGHYAQGNRSPGRWQCLEAFTRSCSVCPYTFGFEKPPSSNEQQPVSCRPEHSECPIVLDTCVQCVRPAGHS